MFSRIYKYESLGKALNYHSVNRYNLIDLVADERKQEYEVSLDFTLKMIGKNSKGGSIFDFNVITIKLPAELEAVLNGLLIDFLYDYQRITSHLIIELKDSGEITAIDNIDEIKFKWEALKARLTLMPALPELDEMLTKGEVDFGTSFGIFQTLSRSPFYMLLFPGIHNQFIDTSKPLSGSQINSFIFPEIAYPIESNLSIQENRVVIESFLDPDNFPSLKSDVKSIDPEIDLSSLFYKSVTEYELDEKDHIKFAESIQIETINGSDEVINYVLIYSA